MSDLPSARSLVEHVVRALEGLGGQAERSAIKEKALERVLIFPTKPMLAFLETHDPSSLRFVPCPGTRDGPLN